MPEPLEIANFLTLRHSYPVFDVRTPKEYQHAHIPGSINLPLFTDEERAIVGTLYKQKGREDAVLEGLKLVGSRLADYIRLAKNMTTSKTLIFHCWRGGMRSNSLAWLFEKAGMKTYTLAGGYKSYRQYIKQSLAEKANIIILGGMTGSGKTELLMKLVDNGEQVLGLEGLAHHKGSAFGAIGESEQPSTEQFENDIFEQWLNFDLAKPIWIEDESHLVGSCFIPEELFVQMRSAPVIKVGTSFSSRIERLVRDYTTADASQLIHSVEKISRKLGGQNAKAAIDAIENNKLAEAAAIILPYYDKSYLFGLAKREQSIIFPLRVDETKPQENIRELINLARVIENK